MIVVAPDVILTSQISLTEFAQTRNSLFSTSRVPVTITKELKAIFSRISIMSSIITAVFKATIGLLVNKGRDKAAKRLKEGDVTEQKFRSLIVREIDDIKSKLDGLSRKDLLASISFFEEGIELLYQVFDKARSRSEGGEKPVQAASAEAFSLADEMRNMKLTDLDESATRALSNAKKRFEDTRREATRAFKNEALTTSDRILAMEYRVMATILETIDNPADAIAPCRVCIKEINCLSAVQNSFNVELRKGIMARFNKDERGRIISSVCHVNRVIFDVTRAVGKEEPFWMWPTVDTEEGNIDPLRDERVVEVLRKQGMEYCFVEIASWSFGEEGVEEHRIENPSGMAINSKGQFIITESDNSKVKMFDRRGQLMDHFNLPFHNVHQTRPFRVFDVAVDMNDNFYVLVSLYKLDSGYEFVVYMFNNNGGVHHEFPVKASRYKSPVMIVDCKRKVVIAGNRFLTGGYVVDVYENDGQFVHSFGGLSERVKDLDLANDDRVIVLDGDSYVHMFSEHGDHLSKFQLTFDLLAKRRIAFHHASEHVVVAEVGLGHVDLQIYTKDWELVRRTQIDEEGIGELQRGMKVTAEGHVALLSDRNSSNIPTGRVFIVF